MKGGRNLRLIVDRGKLVLPRTIDLQMTQHIPNQIRQSLPLVIARAVIMHVTKSALDRVGARAIGRQIKQLKARMSLQPLLDDPLSIRAPKGC